MAFNITEITSAINANGGIAKPNLFFVVITPPSSLLSSTYPRDAMFFCDAAQLPGLSFASQPIRSVGYGTVEQRPTDTNFSTLNTTFIVDARGRAFRFFQQWAALINNWSREPVGVMRGSDLSYGEWNYPATYEGIVEIHCVNAVNQRNEVITYQLSKAFPIQIGDINVAWEVNDSIMRLPISFAYNTWNTTNVPPSLSTDKPNMKEGISLLQSQNLTLGQASSFANQFT